MNNIHMQQYGPSLTIQSHKTVSSTKNSKKMQSPTMASYS
jgi:hypothetical protein